MPIRGQMEGKVHVMPLRVYYEDTDAAGIVYYANYLKFAERGRTEMLGKAGIHLRDLKESDQVDFAIRHAEIDYMKPARLNDFLTVRTWVTGVKGASLLMEQSICREADELVRVKVRVACMHESGKPVRIPKTVKGPLDELIVEA